MAKKQFPEELIPLVKAGIPTDKILFETGENGTVTELEVTDAFLSDLSLIGQLKDLNKLTLSNNHLRDIHTISSLSNLKELYLVDNQIRDIWPISSLSGLTVLELFDNQIQDIEAIGSLNNLTLLDLGQNKIKDINPLSKLRNLKQLYIYNNQLINIDPISSLNNLTTLFLGNNFIIDINPIKSLTTLRSLYLHNNQIQNINPVSSLSNLKNLYLYNNQIQDIEPISSLSNLSELYLHHNQIQDIKPISSLSNLEKLSLAGNQIQDIQPIISLSFLAQVEIEGNPVTNTIPPETLDAGWPQVRTWLLNQEKNALVLIREAKMLFLGNSNVGKSDLLSLLENESLPATHDSTHGIVYKALQTILPDTTVHCWDFGGQEFYHATHQLFFSEGALHLLLWSFRDVKRIENEQESFFEPDYWMRCIEQLSLGKGKNVETIAIENKIDLEPEESEEEKRKRTYHLLYHDEPGKEFKALNMHTCRVSLQQGMRMEGLKEMIKERLGKLLEIQKHPKDYKQ